MKHVICLSVALAVCGTVAPPASADTTIETKHDDSPQTFYATDNALRLDYPQGTMIFRGDKEVLWTIDAEHKSYQEITKEDLEKLGDQLAAMKSQMEEAMKSMPPEQRAMAEKMMAGKLPQSASEKKQKAIKSLGAKKTINGFETEGYQVYLDGVLEEEVWAASPKALGLDAKDFEVFHALAEFMKAGIPGMEELLGGYAKDFEKPAADEIPGFPVLTIDKDQEGQEAGRTELVKVEKGKIDAAKFELPEGLKKVSNGLQ